MIRILLLLVIVIILQVIIKHFLSDIELDSKYKNMITYVPLGLGMFLFKMYIMNVSIHIGRYHLKKSQFKIYLSFYFLRVCCDIYLFICDEKLNMLSIPSLK